MKFSNDWVVFYLENCLKFSTFEGYMFCTLLLLLYVKNIIDNTYFDNSESETELPDFSTLKPFDMEPGKKKVNGKNYA